MMRWKPNRHSNYISYIGRQAREVLPRFQNVCDMHLRQGIAVGPSHAQHFEEKKKKGPMQQPTEQRSGSPLRQTMLARWVTFAVLGLALRKSSR